MPSALYQLSLLLCFSADAVGGVMLSTALWMCLLGLVFLKFQNAPSNTASVLTPITISLGFVLSIFHAVDFIAGWQFLMPVMSGLVLFLCLPDLERERCADTLLLLVVASAAVGTYQLLAQPNFLLNGNQQHAQYFGRASGHLNYPNAFGALLVLVSPLTLAGALDTKLPIGRRLLLAIAFLILSAGVMISGSRACILIHGLSIILQLSLTFANRGEESSSNTKTLVAVGAAIVALAIVAIELFPKSSDRIQAMPQLAKYDSRIVIWDAALASIAEHPVTGGKLGSFEYRFEKFRPPSFNQNPVSTHNEYLHWFHDLGFAGLLVPLAFGILLLIQNPLSQLLSSSQGIVCIVALLAASLLIAFDFHLQFFSINAALGLILGQSLRLRMPDFSLTRWAEPVRYTALGLLILAAVLCLLVATPRLYAESLRQQAHSFLAELRHDTGQQSAQRHRTALRQAEDLLNSAYAYDPDNLRTNQDLALLLCQKSRLFPSQMNALGAKAEQHAQHALKLYPFSYETYLRLGVAADLQGDYVRSGQFFTSALNLAPNNLNAWYHYAYHLSLSPENLPLTKSAIAVCLRLDPGHQPSILLSSSLSSAK